MDVFLRWGRPCRPCLWDRMTAPVSPCVVGMLLAVSMDTRRTKTAVCGGNVGDFAVDRAFRPGWIVKQEKTGWVAIAPTRHFTAAGNAGCMAVLEEFCGFRTVGRLLSFGWVAICSFGDGWVTTSAKCLMYPLLWVAQTFTNSSCHQGGSMSLR